MNTGGYCSQLCPSRFCTQERASKQTLRPEFVCFVTLGNREKHRDRRSNAHRLESGVCGEKKNVEPSKYEQFVTRMVELRGPRTTRENACIPFVIFLFQKISLKWSADSAGEGGWMCATEHEFHCGHGARRSLQ